MATDTATSQAQGICNFAVGSFTGAGADVEVTLGFRPRYVKLINLTDRIVNEVTSDFAATHTLKTAADGTATDDTDSDIVLKGGGATDTYRGFFVPLAVAINAKVMHWIALG